MKRNAESILAAVQMNTAEDVADNLKQAEALIADAAGKGARMVALPEVFACYDGRKYQALGQQEMSPEGKLRSTMSHWAEKYSVVLTGGTIPVLDEQSGKVYPRCYVYDTNGEEAGYYDKIHLFDVDVDDDHGSYRESDFFLSGDKAVVVETAVGKVGLTICYDLRFPYLFDRLRKMGADIIVVPAAFTAVTGAAHWTSLIRARAIETQCYIVAPNQCGEHTRNRHTYGHSMIVSPWGEVLSELGDEPGICIAESSQEELSRIRLSMPLLTHQRMI